MKVIYVSGPYRAKRWLIALFPFWQLYRAVSIARNIARAYRAAKRLWGPQCAVICPHANTAFMDAAQPDHVWLDGDLEILTRCDAIFMLKRWPESEGACLELQTAIAYGLEVIYEEPR